MSPLGKLLGIVMMQRSLSTTSLFRHFLWGVAMFIVCSVVIGVVFGALLLGIFCAIYHGLLSYGLQPEAAGVMLAVIALLVIAFLCSLLKLKIYGLQNSMPHLLRMHSPVASQVNDVVESFLDGLFGSRNKEK